MHAASCQYNSCEDINFSLIGLQGGCKNCHILEKELQNKIIELRSKDVGLIELQQLCEKMEKQLMQQVNRKPMY